MSDSPSNQLLREQGEEIAYRPFNPLAPLAFVFGLLSLLTIASFAFIAAGISGIIVGMVAISGCKEGRARSGFHLARAAVFFSAFGLALGIGYYGGRVGWLGHIARIHAEELITYVENDLLEEAHSVSYPYYMRPEPGTNMVDYYINPEAPPGHNNIPPVAALNFWMFMHPTGTICEDELRGKHEYVCFQEYKKINDVENIVLRYRYIPASPDIESFVYDVDMKRRIIKPPIGIQWEGFFKAVFFLTGDEIPVRETATSITTPRRRFKNPGNDEANNPSRPEAGSIDSPNPAGSGDSPAK